MGYVHQISVSLEYSTMHGKCPNTDQNKLSKLHIWALIRERRQLGFVTLNGNLAVSGWVGLAYDR